MIDPGIRRFSVRTTEFSDVLSGIGLAAKDRRQAPLNRQKRFNRYQREGFVGGGSLCGFRVEITTYNRERRHIRRGRSPPTLNYEFPIRSVGRGVR